MSDIKLDLFTWCPGVELNHGHRDFQSRALPTELPGHWSGPDGPELNRALRYSGPTPQCPERGFALKLEP